MKAKLLTVLTLGAFVAVPAFAEDAYGVPTVTQATPLTRAQVRAELQDAEAKGLLNQTDTTYPSEANRTLGLVSANAYQRNAAREQGGGAVQARPVYRVISDPDIYSKP